MCSLPADLIKIVVWSTKWKEVKKSMFVIPALYSVVNPFQATKNPIRIYY